MKSRAAPTPLVAVLALIVAACASVPSPPRPAIAEVRDAPFVIDGRLSARRGSDAVAVAFSWTHAPPRDDVVLTNPLGQALAELAGDSSLGSVEVRLADGRREVARDWATLTERAVGFPLPVGALAWWAQGAARTGVAHTTEFDAAGRADVLRQDGCEIVYAYGDGSARRPSRLTLVCHDLEMRIVIDRWRDS